MSDMDFQNYQSQDGDLDKEIDQLIQKRVSGVFDERDHALFLSLLALRSSLSRRGRRDSEHSPRQRAIA